MKKLSKTRQQEKDKHSAALFDAYTELQEAIDAFNKQIEEAKSALEAKTAEFNATLDAARTFCEEVVAEMDDYEADRSDKWHESDAASSFQDWKSEWESVSLDDFEPDFPGAIEGPENPQETIDELPSEVA